jgi:NAD(P)-dependent dehydrogenase (short-subunit alcohol dehydrogenase family)
MMKKRTLITGCSKQDGVGYQLAQELIQRGHHVIATVGDVSGSDLPLVNTPGPGSLRIKPLNLCDAVSVQALIDEELFSFVNLARLHKSTETRLTVLL